MKNMTITNADSFRGHTLFRVSESLPPDYKISKIKVDGHLFSVSIPPMSGTDPEQGVIYSIRGIVKNGQSVQFVD